ncbi:MAG: ASKHA domain-containing protein [Nitrospirota bacterium]
MVIGLATGETFTAEKNENLLQTLKKQGIFLVASCGGKGICGKCRVRIKAGKTRIISTGKLQRRDIRAGIVLACQAFPEEDLVVEIPKESKLAIGDVIEVSSAKDLFALFESMGGKISPLVKWISLDIPPPSLDNNVSDLERLKNSLHDQGIADMRFPHGFVSTLAESMRSAGWKINFAYFKGPEALFTKRSEEAARFGIAADIGTTTVVVYLVDLKDGSIMDVGSTYNSQIRYGDDVITRIIHAAEGGGLSELRETVVNDVNDLLSPMLEKHSAASDNIESAVISGNTTMAHLFWGFNPAYIREEPYTPTLNYFPLWRAEEAGLRINPGAPIYTLPCVASYVGGDIVAGVLASQIHRKSEISLFMDIGTNGEIVIGNREWLVTAACSAGPCFEGSGIRHGMRATKGAIGAVKIDRQTLEPLLGVIGDSKPVGICGSGMIDAITELFLSGLIDQKGKFLKETKTDRIREGFEGPEFIVYRDDDREIVLTEVDIENIMRAKAAIYAGVSLLFKKVGLNLGDIERVYIGGGFGNYLDIEKAIVIGMLPDIAREKFRLLGNTSIAGAYLCLLSEDMRKEAEEIAQKMTNIELSVSRMFMDEYLSALFLPHTDSGLFPTVKRLLQEK